MPVASGVRPAPSYINMIRRFAFRESPWTGLVVIPVLQFHLQNDSASTSADEIALEEVCLLAFTKRRWAPNSVLAREAPGILPVAGYILSYLSTYELCIVYTRYSNYSMNNAVMPQELPTRRLY